MWLLRNRCNEVPNPEQLLALQGDYISVFNTPEGQRVLLDLCDRAGITKFTSDATHEALLIQKGSQRLVFGILNLLNTEPAVLLNRMNKNTTRTYDSTE